MNIKNIMSFLLCITLFVLPELTLATEKDGISQELTTLFRAARKVISVNQGHINKVDLGDKGLSAQAVSEKTLVNYSKTSGKKLDANSLTPAQKAMLAAVQDVMSENQDLINEKGVGFKGFLPAIFARQVANKFNIKMSGKMKIKLTAPKSYVRNRANRPDKWENNIIETMFKKSDYKKGQSFSESTQVKGKNAYRFILPEYYGPSCLNCHGTPKGERDITGGKKEGGVLNELGGAISLIIFD
ncbi:Tll0287-like domain-containing protein [Pseudoalteromonas denitrificans]|uniref:Tll0287-like domain-containing protein n=1 Tax=Pseudoalteromonas denitrificans DSM 6059 TaxID=1123010 RepID=A0A1I1U2J8_9GAMM|nr:DUF3365 domain-containing protein [Pseudoalteromonas denitrificans]SFD62913.1 Protein of unknown function [Pseudoalteromonas denitrificans DSM 6059]